MKIAADAPWWSSYFSRLYGVLYQGALAPELATERDVETLVRVFAGAEGPVLDAGCGHGRHLVPLREAGVPAIGIDFSAELLGMVPRRHRKALVRGDFRGLPFADGSFAGAALLFNTFGYFPPEENEVLLEELARVLRPGAPLVMDLPSRAGMKAATENLPPSVRVQGKVSIYEAWHYDEEAQSLLAEGSWTVGEEAQNWRLAMRLHTPAELARMLRRAGFRKDVEFRPIEEMTSLGDGSPSPPPGHRVWGTVTNMAVLAMR